MQRSPTSSYSPSPAGKKPSLLRSTGFRIGLLLLGLAALSVLGLILTTLREQGLTPGEKNLGVAALFMLWSLPALFFCVAGTCFLLVSTTVFLYRRSTKTKYWLAVLAALVVVVVSGGLVRTALRETHYNRALNEYSQAVKPGTKRSDVEAYLKSRNVEFSRMCCSGAKLNAMDDLVQVGHEKAGLICIERNVYVAFQFEAVELNDKWVADSDRLVGTTLFRSVCLDLP